MDRTDAGKSPLEWYEEAKAEIDRLAREATAGIEAQTKSSLDALYDLFKQQIITDVSEMLTDEIVSSVNVQLDVLKDEMIAESKTEIYSWAVSEIIADATRALDEGIDTAVASSLTSLKGAVDGHIAYAASQKISEVTSAIKTELSNYTNTLCNKLKAYNPQYLNVSIPACGDVVCKTKADQLKAQGVKLRKIGQQGVSTSWGGEVLLSVGTNELITEDTTFSDDISEYGITAVLSSTLVNVSAENPFYHVGTASQYTEFIYQVTYEKYDESTGMSWKALYWRTNISAATLEAEYRGIDEYVVIEW